MKHTISTLVFFGLFLSSFLANADNKTTHETDSSEATQSINLDKIKAKEGTNFTRLAEPLKVATGDKIEVRELFWYGCPHCNQLEPIVIQWEKNKPENSEFIPMPAVFSQRWVFHAKVYFTLQALGIDEKAHPMVFESIHKLRKPINNLRQLNAFLKSNNFDIEPEKVENAFNSFSVDTNMRAANAYSLKSGANGVPAVIVDGKFLANVTSAGGGVQLFQLVNELIELAQSERDS